MKYTKIGKCSKVSVFLTDPRLRDMSRKSIEADVKRKFDMKSVYHLSSSREKKISGRTNYNWS